MFKKIFKKLKNINKKNNIELTEDEAKLFDFIYFDADGQKRDFEEVLICIGLTVNKNGIPIDTKDKTRLKHAREIFNSKNFVKKDKLFVSTSKKISGFLSQARWVKVTENYTKMLQYSVLMGLYASLLKNDHGFLPISQTVTAAKSTKLEGLAILSKLYIRQNSLDKKEVLYYIAHRKYESLIIKLSELVPSFEKKPTFDGLRDLLNTSKECIESYKAQSGWQFYQDSEYTNQNWRNRKTLLEQSKQEHQGFLETIKSALSVIFINIPENYKDFCELVEDYYTYFDSLTDEVRLSGLIEIINKCPENIDFNQKPKFDNVTPGNAIFPKID